MPKYLIEASYTREGSGACRAPAGARGATVRTVVVLTPEEIDATAKRSVEYRAPGA